jgi:hypothetical protein
LASTEFPAHFPLEDYDLDADLEGSGVASAAPRRIYLGLGLPVIDARDGRRTTDVLRR